MLNALTIDVEDYFQVQAFADVIPFQEWDKYECRVESNTDRVLEILQTAGKQPVNATFFILGWIAERYPDLVKRIKAAGHEIACHGYAHKLIYNQSKDEFRNDIRKSKAILEDITGEAINGYRAPSYSITSRSLWAFEILRALGFKYDSSVFPIRHDFYGLPDAPRFPFTVSLDGDAGPSFMPLNREDPASLVEFPITTIRIGAFNLPIAGGGYFRLLPYAMTGSGLHRINDKEHQPFVFYLHPWEIDPGQPRISAAGLRSRFRHYLNLNKTEARFRRLLEDFAFTPIRDIIQTITPSPPLKKGGRGDFQKNQRKIGDIQ